MKAQYKHKISTSKKKKRIDWKKRIIYFLTAMLIANFAWDAYNRIPKIKVFANTYYSKALKLLDKTQED